MCKSELCAKTYKCYIFVCLLYYNALTNEMQLNCKDEMNGGLNKKTHSMPP